MTPQEIARKRKFDAICTKIRTCNLYDKAMGSVADVVTEMATPAAKRAKSTLHQKMPVWSKKFNWPGRSWTRTPQFRSRTGGGKWGLAATMEALEDIHRHLQ